MAQRRHPAGTSKGGEFAPGPVADRAAGAKPPGFGRPAAKAAPGAADAGTASETASEMLDRKAEAARAALAEAEAALGAARREFRERDPLKSSWPDRGARRRAKEKCRQARLLVRQAEAVKPHAWRVGYEERFKSEAGRAFNAACDEALHRFGPGAEREAFLARARAEWAATPECRLALDQLSAAFAQIPELPEGAFITRAEAWACLWDAVLGRLCPDPPRGPGRLGRAGLRAAQFNRGSASHPRGA